MTRASDAAVTACGAQGCSITPATVSEVRPGVQNQTLELQIVSDAICPWCFVAKRQMETALAQLIAEGTHLTVRWLPFELNPDMPKAGMDRREYRTLKFGSWEESQALDAQVAAAAKTAGITFRHDLMQRTPNTFDAHRLIWLAGREHVQDAVVEGIFRAYFTEGRDVGDSEVLSDIAATAGLGRERVRSFLAGTDGTEEVRSEIDMARRAGIQGVPTFVVDGYPLFSGAQPVDVMTSTLREIIVSTGKEVTGASLR